MSSLTTSIVPTRERVEYYIQLLKKLNKKFDHPQDAYKHIKKQLDETEIFHQAVFDRMCILPFSDFRYDEIRQIYFRETIKQSILINLNGSYGIYQNLKNTHTESMEYYKNTPPSCLVHIANIEGKNLWSK